MAVMAHVRLRNQRTNQRVLPVYYSENYVSLLPGESRTITIEAALQDLGGARPLVVVDGWNVTAKAMDFLNAAALESPRMTMLACCIRTANEAWAMAGTPLPWARNNARTP
jgi:hypothetical protein